MFSLPNFIRRTPPDRLRAYFVDGHQIDPPIDWSGDKRELQTALTTFVRELPQGQAEQVYADFEQVNQLCDEPGQRALRSMVLDDLDAYEAALSALREDTQEWWADELARGPDDLEECEEPVQPDSAGLRSFIESNVLPWFETRRRDLGHRPLIREQAFGEALDPDKLDRLGRYEVHLDRKFERTLSMLLRLKDLRRPTLPG